ncbi:MAG: response regulator [Oscillospiraceae bacterium]|nr:response regulator [Oscillospiraceae bacterium]
MTINEMTVMICDDSMFARKKMKDYILSLGVAACYEAADGEQAVENYKEYKPSIVFMDIVMPKKTGIDAVKEIIEFDPDAKIVMASSVGTQNHLKEAINAGAFEFLQKPISNDQISKLIEMITKGV